MYQITLITSKPLTAEDIDSIKAYAEARATNSVENIETNWAVYGWRGKSSDTPFGPNISYRIKPASTEPTYRPWTPEEALGHKIREKGREVPLYYIHTANVTEVHVDHNRGTTYESLLQNFETVYGKPCGVLIEPEAPAVDPNFEFDHNQSEQSPVSSGTKVLVRLRPDQQWYGPHVALDVVWHSVDKYKIVV